MWHQTLSIPECRRSVSLQGLGLYSAQLPRLLLVSPIQIYKTLSVLAYRGEDNEESFAPFWEIERIPWICAWCRYQDNIVAALNLGCPHDWIVGNGFDAILDVFNIGHSSLVRHDVVSSVSIDKDKLSVKMVLIRREKGVVRILRCGPRVCYGPTTCSKSSSQQRPIRASSQAWPRNPRSRHEPTLTTNLYVDHHSASARRACRGEVSKIRRSGGGPLPRVCLPSWGGCRDSVRVGSCRVTVQLLSHPTNSPLTGDGLSTRRHV